MSDSLPTQTGCCTSTPNNNPNNVPVPGPAGANGVNAFTVTTASFIMPASGSNVAVSVATTSFMVVGQTLFVQTAGYMKVVSIGSNISVTLQNTGATGNAAAATTIPSISGVTPAGAQGTTPTFNSISPTTTKGDLIIDSGANSPAAADVRFPAGTNNFVLHTDSTQTNGAQWRGVDLAGAATTLLNALPIAKGGTGQITQQLALNALMPSGAIAGNMVVYNGTNWVALATGLNHQVLRTNTGATAAEWAYQGTIQTVEVINTTYTSISTTFTLNDTIPTSANGTQILSASITPVYASSKIGVDIDIPINCSGAQAVAALFLSGNAAAMMTQISETPNGAGGFIRMRFSYINTGITALTFNVNLGVLSGSVYMNGNSGGRLFGGTLKARITLSEYV